MKRVIGAMMCLVLLAGTALPTMAQGRRGRYAGRTTQYGRSVRRYEVQRRGSYDSRYNSRYNTRYNSRYNSQYNNRYGYNRGYYRDRSFWDKHRDKLTVAAGTGAGALIGGVAGGKKGAIIGALLGAGGSALYTYKLRNRNGRRY